MNKHKCEKKHSEKWEWLSVSGGEIGIFTIMREDRYCPVCNRGRTNHRFSITLLDRLKFKIRHWLRKKQMPF